MRSLRLFAAAVAVVASATWPRAASADGPLGPQGSRLQTSSYTVDLFQGPILAGSRVTALAGAWAALAEGAEGHGFNAASPAVREAHSTSTTDFDVDFGLTFPSSIGKTDFDNNGSPGFTYDNFVFGTLGARVQEGKIAIGATINLQQYELGNPGNVDGITSILIRYARGNLLGAYSLLSDQLYVGGGPRAALLGIIDSRGGSERELLTVGGLGVEGGAVVAPKWLPLRFGLTLRSPVDGKVDPASRVTPDERGDRRIGEKYLPESIVMPWEVEWGLALQLGKRPLNPGWNDPEAIPAREVAARARPGETPKQTAKRIAKERYAALPRQKLLVTTSFLVTGATSNAVGFESFLSQRIDRSGERISFTPRVGLEGEVVPSWLQLRAGSYMEPSRFQGGRPRVHGTAGFEQKLFSWTAFGLFYPGTYFRVSGAVDVAREYFGWSLGAGVWH